MNTNKIASGIGSIVILLMVAACGTGQSGLPGNSTMRMDSFNYNWPQIIGGFLGGLIIGYLLGRKNR